MGVFVWPVPGFSRVTSGFRTAQRPNHNGIDIGRCLAPPKPIEGAEVVAVAAGFVSKAGRNHASMGNWLELEHCGGWVSRYMHNDVNFAFEGLYVAQGDVIALVGSTGRSTAPHLHVELLRHGLHVDPALWLGV